MRCEFTGNSVHYNRDTVRDGTVLYSKVPVIIDRSEPNFHRSYSKGANCDVHIFRDCWNLISGINMTIVLGEARHLQWLSKPKFWIQNLFPKSQIDKSSFERVEDFKYMGTTLTNRNSIQEEIKSRLKSGQVQNILSSSLLSKHLKIKIYKIIFLSAVTYGYETWSLTFERGTWAEGVWELGLDENIWA